MRIKELAAAQVPRYEDETRGAVIKKKKKPSSSSALQSNITHCEQMSRREKSPGESDNQPNRGSRNSVHRSNSAPRFGCIQP